MIRRKRIGKVEPFNGFKRRTSLKKAVCNAKLGHVQSIRHARHRRVGVRVEVFHLVRAILARRLDLFIVSVSAVAQGSVERCVREVALVFQVSVTKMPKTIRA